MGDLDQSNALELADTYHRDAVAGTCCAGHCHAASHANGKQTKCEGGGTRTISIVGNTAASRVDHADIGGWRGGTLKGAHACYWAASVCAISCYAVKIVRARTYKELR